jgi:hypothetical protein
MAEMRRLLLFAPLLVLLVSCDTIGGGIGGETPRHALSVFCSLKQSAIGQVLLTPAQLAAGRMVCQAIGAGMGNPG